MEEHRSSQRETVRTPGGKNPTSLLDGVDPQDAGDYALRLDNWTETTSTDAVPDVVSSSRHPPLAPGVVVARRYGIARTVHQGPDGVVFDAIDRVARARVALRLVTPAPPEARVALCEELLLARSVTHPTVCRVHDLIATPWGPMVIMEFVTGQTLDVWIEKHGERGIQPNDYRSIAADICAGLAAIHARGLVHGALSPRSICVDRGRAVIVDLVSARWRQRMNRCDVSEDLGALAMVLRSMWSPAPLRPGETALSIPLRQQTRASLPGHLSPDELKQVFLGLGEHPESRPAARAWRFFRGGPLTPTGTRTGTARLDAGVPLGRSASSAFKPGESSLLITYAAGAPELVGNLIPLEKPVLTLGRGRDRDVVLREPTVSGMHARMTWRAGTWELEDARSQNGVFADRTYERQTRVTLRQGDQFQLAELRAMLVSFAPNSERHGHARRYLAVRDGASGLLLADQLPAAIEKDRRFARWADIPHQLAFYDLRAPRPPAGGRPHIQQLLIMRRAAPRITELTELQLLSLFPVVAGRCMQYQGRELLDTVRIVVSMLGIPLDTARPVVERVASEVRGILPKELKLSEAIVVPGRGDRTEDLIG